MWNHDIGMEEIRRFSLGCGVETGNLLSWFNLINKVDLPVHVKKLKGPSCTYREGEYLSVLVAVRKQSSVNFAGVTLEMVIQVNHLLHETNLTTGV